MDELVVELNKIKAQLKQEVVERKQLESALRKAERRAEQALKTGNLFWANLGHVIKTPIASLVGYSQILNNKSNAYSIPQECKSYLQIIQQSSENLSELINCFLDLSKIETGELKIQNDPVNFPLLMQNIINISQSSAFKKQVEININLAPDLPEFITSDRLFLNKILFALICNAVNLSQQGRPVSIKSLKEDKWIVLDIETHTCVQKAEYEDRDFEENEPDLVLIKKMLVLLGGAFQVQSEQNHRMYKLRIPYQEVQVQQLSGEKKASTDSQILLVEDDPVSRQMLAVLLGEFGLRPIMAENGQEAIDYSLGAKPDLLIIDMHMPGMKGWEAIMRIRCISECRSIPIIAMSGENSSQLKELAKQAGADDYLVKPLSQDKLVQVLQKYIDFKPQILDKFISRPPIPDNIKEQLLQEYKKLAAIPHYYVRRIDAQVEKMILLCEAYSSPYIENLKQIKAASDHRQSRQIPQLIKLVESLH